MEFTALNQFYVKLIFLFKRWRFGNKAQLAFLEDLSVLINDGIPANRAVEMMAQITTGLTREVALSIAKKIAQGQLLAEGMRDWFNINVIEIIRIGEAGGALGQTIKSAINLLSQRGVAISSFVGAMVYPLIVLTIACIVIVYLNQVVFEQFKLIKPVSQWPASGRQFIAIAELIQYWWWVVILVIIMIVLIFHRLMTHYTGSLRAALDQFPPFSFYRQLTAARLLETLGLLVENGVVFKSALRVMQHQSNPYMHYHLTLMEGLLSKGKTNIADVLATGLVDEKDLMRLRVMAEVKGFEHGLVRMGVRGTEQATTTLKLIARIVGGVLLALGGLLILMIIQGIYMTGMAMGA
ncbi:MAG TPA: type II secretion system F family protein [Gammaproteobacteria bacterium]|jgi:type II secretory pathway component PulF|nr:type II secretion system F family protein [Gammaproteobacteria bacterium]